VNEAKVLDLLKDEGFRGKPIAVWSAMHYLGVIRSKKAVPVLCEMLLYPGVHRFFGDTEGACAPKREREQKAVAAGKGLIDPNTATLAELGLWPAAPRRFLRAGDCQVMRHAFHFTFRFTVFSASTFASRFSHVG
jgi:hypothetical protein